MGRCPGSPRHDVHELTGHVDKEWIGGDASPASAQQPPVRQGLAESVRAARQEAPGPCRIGVRDRVQRQIAGFEVDQRGAITDGEPQPLPTGTTCAELKFATVRVKADARSTTTI